MMETLQLTENVTMLYGEGVAVSLFDGDKLRGGKMQPTSTVRKDLTSTASSVAFWGTNNCWPQQVVKEINESDVLRPLIVGKAKRQMGEGLAYGKFVKTATGYEVREIRVPEVERWLKRTNATLFCYESWLDWITHGNIFPEFQMTFGGQVAAVYCQDANRVRLKKKDEDGRISTAYLSGRWPENVKPGSEHVMELPALDPYYDVAGQIMASKQARLIMPVRILVDDNDYYGQAPWHGLIVGGYLELAKAIIRSKLHLTRNLALLRFHIEIGSEFWEAAYPGFTQKPIDERRKLKEDVRDAFTNWITGQEKSGRTLLTDMVLEDIGHGKVREYRSLWKITPIKLDIPTGAYVEDSAEVDAKIIRAFVDAALFNQTPSKDRNSSGSGSDKRIAHTIDLLDNQIDAEMVLKPFDIVSEVNGWHELYGDGNLVWWFRALHTTTRDQTMGMVTEKDTNKPKPSKAQ